MAKPTQMLRIIANESCFVIMASPAYLATSEESAGC